MTETFEQRLLRWLQTERRDAVEVVSCSGYGTDWSGDTNSGFHSSFSVDITYKTTSGAKHYFDVQGEDLNSLWTFVIKELPKEW